MPSTLTAERRTSEPQALPLRPRSKRPRGCPVRPSVRPVLATPVPLDGEKATSARSAPDLRLDQGVTSPGTSVVAATQVSSARSAHEEQGRSCRWPRGSIAHSLGAARLAKNGTAPDFRSTGDGIGTTGWPASTPSIVGTSVVGTDSESAREDRFPTWSPLACAER